MTEPTNEVTPLNCPLCASASSVRSPGIRAYVVRCDTCHTETACYETPELAVERWNRRAGAAPSITDEMIAAGELALPVDVRTDSRVEERERWVRMVLEAALGVSAGAAPSKLMLTAEQLRVAQLAVVAPLVAIGFTQDMAIRERTRITQPVIDSVLESLSRGAAPSDWKTDEKVKEARLKAWARFDTYAGEVGEGTHVGIQLAQKEANHSLDALCDAVASCNPSPSPSREQLAQIIRGVDHPRVPVLGESDYLKIADAILAASPAPSTEKNDAK